MNEQSQQERGSTKNLLFPDQVLLSHMTEEKKAPKLQSASQRIEFFAKRRHLSELTSLAKKKVTLWHLISRYDFREKTETCI